MEEELGRGVYLLTLLPLVALSEPSHSEEVIKEMIGYRCTLRSAYEVEGGAQSPAVMARSPIGDAFIVERSTGQIIGKSFVSADWEVKAIEPGSDAQSFKVFFVTPPHVSLRLLVVNEYQQGRMKEFVLMENSTVYTGLCEHSTVKWRRID